LFARCLKFEFQVKKEFLKRGALPKGSKALECAESSRMCSLRANGKSLISNLIYAWLKKGKELQVEE
jgi:hypothetical protein